MCSLLQQALDPGESAKPKVLMFAPSLRKGVVGGVASYSSFIMNSEALTRKFALTLVDLEDISASDALWFRVKNRLYTALHGFDSTQTLLFWNRVRRAKQAIYEIGPDIVVCFFTNSDHFFWLLLQISRLARSRGARILADYHAGGFNVLWNSLSPPKRAKAKLLLRDIDIILVRNRPAVQLFEHIAPSDRVKRIFNPAPTTRMVPAPAALPQSGMEGGLTQIAFVGVKTPKIKGAHLLLEAVPALAASIPGIRIVMAGEDSGAMKAAIAKAGGAVESHVFLCGSLSPEGMRSLYQSSHIFVMPSYSEGFPIALLEAMSCGVACVASRVGAIPEIIEDGKNGLLIEPDNVPQLVTSLLRLCLDPELRRTLGAAGREHVVANFSEAMFERVFGGILEDLLRTATTHPRTGV